MKEFECQVEMIKCPTLDDDLRAKSFFFRFFTTRQMTQRVLQKPAFLAFLARVSFSIGPTEPVRSLCSKIHRCMFGLFRAKIVQFKAFVTDLTCF